MKCHNCKKDIDLEMTPEEEVDCQKELDEHKVVMVCYKCYEPLEGLSQKLPQDIK